MTDDLCILFYRVWYCTSYRTENKLFYFIFIFFFYFFFLNRIWIRQKVWILMGVKEFLPLEGWPGQQCRRSPGPWRGRWSTCRRQWWSGCSQTRAPRGSSLQYSLINHCILDPDWNLIQLSQWIGLRIWERSWYVMSSMNIENCGVTKRYLLSWIKFDKYRYSGSTDKQCGSNSQSTP